MVVSRRSSTHAVCLFKLTGLGLRWMRATLGFGFGFGVCVCVCVCVCLCVCVCVCVCSRRHASIYAIAASV